MYKKTQQALKSFLKLQKQNPPRFTPKNILPSSFFMTQHILYIPIFTADYKKLYT